jgi:hypothetical protein
MGTVHAPTATCTGGNGLGCRWTALGYFSSTGNERAVELLVAAGADVDVKDNDGYRPAAECDRRWLKYAARQVDGTGACGDGESHARV